MVRLDKFLCDCGAGTRSQVKAMLKAGRVRVDGSCTGDGSRKLDPEHCTVELDGTLLTRRGRTVLMLNKPAGFVTATEDARDRTVMELLPREYQALKPVGRLDKTTEGLLLFTDDGELLHRLISPKRQIPKVYYARHEGSAGPEDVLAFRQGLTLKDGTVCLPAELDPIGPGESRVTVCEGKYHQVRRMMASRGMPVTYLERQQEGPFSLGELPRGGFRLLSAEEILQLSQQTGTMPG